MADTDNYDGAKLDADIAALERVLNDHAVLRWLVSDIKYRQAAVHLNMLRGVIAKPTLRQMLHVYGNGAREAMDTLVAIAERNEGGSQAVARIKELLDAKPDTELGKE